MKSTQATDLRPDSPPGANVNFVLDSSALDRSVFSMVLVLWLHKIDVLQTGKPPADQLLGCLKLVSFLP